MTASTISKTPTFLGALAAYLLAGIVVLGGNVQEAQANQFKRINDINVSCNNALRCDLFIINPRVTLSNFGIRRAAAPDAPVSIVLISREQFSRGSEVRLLVNNEPIATIPASEFSFRAAVSEFIYSDQTVVRDVVEAAKAGGQLQIEYQSRLGATSASFALEGYLEGLAFLDQVQGRTGRDSALSGGVSGQETTSGEVSEVTAFGDVPFAIRSRYYSNSNSICGGIDNNQRADMGGLRIGAGAEGLYLLPCDASDGDNTPYAFFQLDGREAHIVPLPVLVDDELTTRNSTNNISFDAETGQLSGLQLDGADQCGTANIWRVGEDADGRLAFTLVEARQAEECDPTLAENSSEWPQIWPPNGPAIAN